LIARIEPHQAQGTVFCSLLHGLIQLVIFIKMYCYFLWDLSEMKQGGASVGGFP
jgi:hypothetical protein